MPRSRPITSSLVIVVLLVLSLGTPVEAGKPRDPYVSRMTGSAGWITSNDYVMVATVYVRNASRRNTLGYRVTWSDGSGSAEGGLALPPAGPSGESMLTFSLGPIPEGASSVTFAAQVQRPGPGGCCAQASPAASVTAALPAPPPAPTEWQVVFDVTFAAP